MIIDYLNKDYEAIISTIFVICFTWIGVLVGIQDKQTERKDSFWLYVLIGLSSIVGWELLKRLFLKLKRYVVYSR